MADKALSRHIMVAGSGALFLALLISCHSSATYHNPSGGLPQKRTWPDVNVSKLEKRIHELINRERRKHGLKMMELDDHLSRIARNHGRDMSKRNYFSHDSPEGRNFSDRYREAGYRCGIRAGNIIYTGAENIFQNNLYDSVTTINGKRYYDWNSLEKIAETTVEGWMNSAGHRKNILTPHWRNEGIGVFISPDDKVFITQNFC